MVQQAIQPVTIFDEPAGDDQPDWREGMRYAPRLASDTSPLTPDEQETGLAGIRAARAKLGQKEMP